MKTTTVALSLYILLWLGHVVFQSNAAYELLPYNPLADPKAVVVFGNARFTVLTPNLIRLEYSNSGRFEDRATVAVLNRLLPVPPFTQSSSGGFLNISTNSLSLSYEIGQPFTKSSLVISSKNLTPSFTWTFGQAAPGNLLGTIKSLDDVGVVPLNCDANRGIRIHDESLHCEWGLISRDGWAVVNDSTNWGLNSVSFWDSPNTDTIDLYFFGHGYNYKQALNDYILIGGKIAMVPRFASGIWWSRWYNFNNIDVLSIVEDYKNRFLPLDVFILDMDWHKKYAWGGYSFDTDLFPYPADALGWLQNQGLAVGANIHDDNGVHPYENMYKGMCNALGYNAADGKVIPFSAVNSTYQFALGDVVLKDVENQGMTFWWIDWQQGGTEGGCHGEKQNPTYILNHARGTDHLRRGEIDRGIVLARWGGLGTHRYQVGFSGDVASLTWTNLAYQPYFSMTASNVAYGFWSHDLVGPATDHELHTRWLQWGAYSAIFRTHDRGMSSGGCSDTPQGCPRIEVWNVPNQYFEANRQAMLAREELLPYIYNAVRQAYDTGVSILRPMYYEYPQLDAAYRADAAGNFGQYFFGDDIFVSPITKPVSSNTSLATTTIWIPPGSWVEKDTGVIHTGAANGQTYLTKSFDLSEIPVFIRSGAIIPKLPLLVGNTIGVARRPYTTLVLAVYPGSISGTTSIYEDDGLTTNYLSGKFTRTTVSYTRTTSTFKLVISVPSGGYTEFPRTRNYVIHLINALPATTVSVNAQAINYARFGGLNTWHYDGPTFTTVVETGILPTSTEVSIIINSNPIPNNYLSGYRGMIQKSILSKRNLDPTWSTPGSGVVQPALLSDVASAGEELSYLAGIDQFAFNNMIINLPNLFVNAIKEIVALQPLPPPPPGAVVQLWNADRMDNCLCATADCLSANNDYQQLRIEGYQPKAGTPGTIPLNDFWDQDINDNYATTQTTTPAGYTPALFSDGIVFRSLQPGTAPLRLYWNGQRKDMLTVASPAGIQYAKQYSYEQVNATLGYVFSEPPKMEVDAVAYSRWSYSVNLLYNASN